MKKKLAAFLCGVMCLTAFTGCSPTELEYLKMGNNLMDIMSSCAVEGTMEADIDFDGLNVMMDDVAKATGVEGDALHTGLNGKKNLTVDYDMNMNLDALEYDMAFDVTYNGRTYDLGKLYYSLNRGVFVSSDTLWGVYQMYGDLVGGNSDQYILSEAFAKDFREVLSEERYIELVSMEQLTGVDLGDAVQKQNMTELYDAAYTFYADVLDGFETGMVKEIKGGYQIKANGREVAQLLADLLYFVADHPDQVIDATEAYMAVVMENTAAGTPEETAAAKEAVAGMFAEARASRDDFIAAARQMAVLAESLMQYPGADIVLDGFDYVGTVKKVNGGFDSVAAYTVKHNGKTVCKLVTDSMMKKADVQIFFPVKSMTVEELEGKLAKLEDKYNPVTGVSVTWGMYDGGSDYADIRTMRSTAEGAYFGINYNWSDMIVENGRAYLPLRVIAEMLGEEVGWENSTKTPYVMQDGQRIDMQGKLQEGRAFVGIRDFEKLGYTVTYTAHKDPFDSIFDYKEVLIEK